MLTGILGLAGAMIGLAPAILQFFTVKANNAQAIAIEQLRLQAAKDNIALQVDLANSNADIEQQRAIYGFASAASGVKWVDAIAVIVRPYITLILFHAWIAMKALSLLYAIANGVDFKEMMLLLWGQEDQAMLMTVLGFWFGDRMMRRSGQQMAATAAVQPTTVKMTPAHAPPTTQHSVATDRAGGLGTG